MDLDLDAAISPGDVVIGRILLARVLEEDGTQRDIILTDDGHGEDLDLPTAVGMCAIGQYILLSTEGRDG